MTLTQHVNQFFSFYLPLMAQDVLLTCCMLFWLYSCFGGLLGDFAAEVWVGEGVNNPRSSRLGHG